MKKILSNIAILISLASLMMMGCQKDNLLDNSKYNTIIMVKADNAKTTFDPTSGDVNWTLGEDGEGGDQINVFHGNTPSDGAFTLLSLENGVASFGGNLDAEATGLYYAVYPYQNDMTIKNGVASCLVVNPEQELVSGSFGDGSNTSCGYSESTTMKFSNIGALAKIYVRGDMAIKSISITDNTDQVIAGYGTIDIPELTFTLNANNGSSKITAEAPTADGIPAAESGQTFYLVMPPCTLSNYTVDITDVDGVVHTKTYTESQDKKVFTRAQVTTVGAYTVSRPPVTPIPDNEIWYTTTDNCAVSIRNWSDGFGANFVDHSYSNGKGVIKYDGPVTAIGAEAFFNCYTLKTVTLPDSIAQIKDKAFVYCSCMESINLPQALTQIGSGAFSCCCKLTEIDIPDNVTYVGGNAFEACTALTSIDIPNGVTSIKSGTFSRCWGLTHIGIPNSVESIGSTAFEGCTSLTSITLPNSITGIGNDAFTGCTALVSITLPNRLTQIPAFMFNGCTSLASVTIPASVTGIEDEAFQGCTSLTSISLPSELGYIGEKAFALSGLRSITIPSSTFALRGNAFLGCSALGTVICESERPPHAEGDLFTNSTYPSLPQGFCIKVPAESVDTYKAARGWSQYADYIQADQ